MNLHVACLEEPSCCLPEGEPPCSGHGDAADCTHLSGITAQWCIRKDKQAHVLGSGSFDSLELPLAPVMSGSLSDLFNLPKYDYAKHI